VFMAKRTLDRSVSTMTTKNAVEEALTPRQQEVLTLAYHAGYFESPRDSTGEDLASVLGIASPTFYRHARKGIQRLLALLIDDLERSLAGD
jgi:predicted DNA binding protein